MPSLTPILRRILAADRDTLAEGGLAALHDRLRKEDISCAALAAEFSDALGFAASTPLASGLATVAAAADRSGSANAFHNPAHSREVAVNWWLLARLHGAAEPVLSPVAAMRGLIAAFGHDLNHDGRGNGIGAAHVPFRLEAVATDAVAALLDRAEASVEDRAVVSALILSTDVRNGYPYLGNAPIDDPRFEPLEDPSVLLAARMLRDADLLPSAGTSIAAYRTRTAELSREMAMPAGASSPKAASGFFDEIVERRFLSPPAQLFANTVRTIAAEATGN